MIICITDQISDEIDFTNEYHRIAITNIFSAFREGKHYVIYTNKFQRNFTEHQNLFQPEIVSSVKQAAICFAVTKKCLSLCSTYIEISNQSEITKYSNIKNKKLVIYVPISRFCDSETIQKTELISENKKDGVIYKFAADLFCNEENLPNSIIYKNTGGGGDTTGDNFLESQENAKNPVFCIVDNDKLSPHCNIGDTAKKVVCNVKINALSGHYIIDVHSIESLFPNKTYRRLLGEDKNKIVALDLHDFIEREFPKAKRYMKVRDGICLTKISDTNAIGYWKTIFEAVEIFDKTLSKKSIPGLGNRLVDRISDDLRANGINNLLDDISSWNEIKPSWLAIGKDIFSWCCAPKPKALT